jgi:hypothetical protein
MEIIMKIKLVFAFLLIVSFITACVQATPTAVSTQPRGNAPTPTIGVPYPALTPTSGISYPAPTPQATEVSLKAAEQAAIQYVSTKYNIPADQIQVLTTEPMTWSNGCMAVVIPGVLCTDVIVHGFVITLEGKGQQFEIHTNQDGSSVVDAAQQLATLGFVVRNSNQTIQLVNPEYPLEAIYNPSFDGFLPTGGATAGTAYVLNTLSLSGVVAVDANGQHELSFIQNPTIGLALWRGGQGMPSMLAWGTQPSGSNRTSSLIIANTDGSNLQTLLTVESGTPAIQLVAELWSENGQFLYFSKEPVGIGGYIIFNGASNLYKINIANRQVSEIIPQASSTQPQGCLDAISLDHSYVADHCTANEITIRDLQTGTSTSLQVPADVSGYRLMGSSRFSPSGDQVAFALAKGNPDNEEGWVAVGSSSGGVANLVLTGEPGSFYNVLGWLDDNTLLVHSIPVSIPNSASQLVIVSSDGSNPTTAAQGVLLAIIDNR